MSARSAWRGGRNIAVKAPPHHGLEHLTTNGASQAFRFGSRCLWIEPAPQLAQTETWCERQTDDLPAAAAHLATHGVARCDDIERLPDGFKGFWIINPAGIANLAAHPSEDPGLQQGQRG